MKEVPIPEEMASIWSDEYREKLIEAVAEYDDALLEKFFDDPTSITVEEMQKLLLRQPQQ